MDEAKNAILRKTGIGIYAIIRNYGELEYFEGLAIA